MSDTSQAIESGAFRDQAWSTKWLVVGLGFLALWYSIRFVDLEWMARWSVWTHLLVALLVPQAFLLLFPFLARDKNQARRIRVPGFERWLVEMAIAVPVVIATVFVLGGLEYLVGQLWPGKTLVPDAISNMAASSPRYVYPILLFSFTFAPVAEEVFFRGFLYNAFRRRMPVFIAGILQSFIFGFCHCFGTTHAVIAVGLGIVLTLVYQWRKTLVSAVFVHAGLNLVCAIGVMAMMAQYAERPMLGVVGGESDTECIVREVLPNSGASEAGIEVGDRIVSFDSRPVANFTELVALVATRQPNETVPLILVRDGETLGVDVTLKRCGDTMQSP